ncbi:MAG: hypothetical protein EBT54_02540 [Betaproteobacteria bacterium]|nr:hypothetical protein [Betaproteobacteria bacterium]
MPSKRTRGYVLPRDSSDRSFTLGESVVAKGSMPCCGQLNAAAAPSGKRISGVRCDSTKATRSPAIDCESLCQRNSRINQGCVLTCCVNQVPIALKLPRNSTDITAEAAGPCSGRRPSTSSSASAALFCKSSTRSDTESGACARDASPAEAGCSLAKCRRTRIERAAVSAVRSAV